MFAEAKRHQMSDIELDYLKQSSSSSTSTSSCGSNLAFMFKCFTLIVVSQAAIILFFFFWLGAIFWLLADFIVLLFKSNYRNDIVRRKSYFNMNYNFFFFNILECNLQAATYRTKEEFDKNCLANTRNEFSNKLSYLGQIFL